MTSNEAAGSLLPSLLNKETKNEPFPGPAFVLHAEEGRVRWRARRDEDRGSLGGRGVPEGLGARQDRALDAWRQLHGILLMEGLRQGRHCHLGNPADGLSAHASRTSQSRTARLRARCEL